MKVLVVEPMKPPCRAEIDGSLESMQKLVGGYIEAVYPFEDPVALVCNEEGKLMGLPPNRLLRNENGEPYDFIAGTFFVAGLSEDSFASLPEEYAKKYEKLFGRELLMLLPKEQGQHRHEPEK